MAKALFEGIVLGLSLAFMIGPVFFSLLQTSLHKGFYFAFLFALGIAFSDIFYILITYMGISPLLANNHFKSILGIVGGVLMLGFGISALLKKEVAIHTPKNEITTKDRLKYIIKGFVLNTLNPGVFFLWLGAAGVVSVNNNFTRLDIQLFYFGTILTTFLTDLLKAYTAKQFSKFLTPDFVLNLNKFGGLLLVFFGIYMSYEGFVLFLQN